jgi:hypothetical protein
MIKTIISPINILLVAILAYFIYNHYETKIAPLFNISSISNELASERCEVIKGIHNTNHYKLI